ncbi:AMP-binding protein [Streptomyces sp. NPDC002851]
MTTGTDPRTTDSGVPFADLLAAVRPPAPVRDGYQRAGRWRRPHHTLLHDLHRAAAAHPHRTAIVAHRAHRPPECRVTRLTYAQLATYTDRFAYALDALGIGPGDPVAFQLPNRWEACALTLACLRTGAVAVPVMTGYGARDLEAVLAASEARLCVVADHGECGTEPARTLAGLAPTLPWLRHRAVIGDAAATGAVDFVRHFIRTPHERHRPTAWLRTPADPADRICLAITSMGLRGAPTMALHTPNTLYAAASCGIEEGPGPRPGPGPVPGSVAWTALPLATLPALLHTVLGPLAHGGTVVLQDTWSAGAWSDTALDLFASAGVTDALATSAQWAELAAAQRRHPRPTTALRRARTPDDAPADDDPAAQRVRETLHVTPRTHRPSTQGPAAPAALWQRDTGGLRPTWNHDTAPGSEAPPEHEGAHRPVDEVGGVFLLPVAEVEAHLAAHPAVAEAALVPWTDPVHGELACAVVVPDGTPPGLLDLRDHLLSAGISPAHLPARLELLGALPRGDHGEVHRGRLRTRLAHRLSPTGP